MLNWGGEGICSVYSCMTSILHLTFTHLPFPLEAQRVQSQPQEPAQVPSYHVGCGLSSAPLSSQTSKAGERITDHPEAQELRDRHSAIAQTPWGFGPQDPGRWEQVGLLCSVPGIQ